MNLKSAAIAATISTLLGCSSFSATIVKNEQDAGGNTSFATGGKPGNGGSTALGGTSPGSNTLLDGGGSTSLGTSDADGGAEPDAGTVSSIGGSSQQSTSTIGGATSAGGQVPIGGTTAATTAASGGTTVAAGGQAAGGTTATGGATAATTATGGSASTGGAPACSQDADCTNPDPINCSYMCVNPGTSGTCKPAALKGPTQCATAACDDKPISGFWDENGKPHIAYAWTETDGTASIRMQQLKLDGTPDGAAVPYLLPADLFEADMLSAAAQGSKIAFLWYGVLDLPQADSNHIFFAVTDLLGSSSTPADLEGSPAGLGVHSIAMTTTASGAWLGLIASGVVVATWQGASGSTIGAFSSLGGLVEKELAAGMVGNTVMATGADCTKTFGSSSCVQQQFILQRYSVGNLSAQGSPIVLSQNAQGDSPAMGPVNGSMALLWAETESPGQMFRTLIKEDGTFALAVGTVQSAIQPKAIIGATNGGALLVGTISSGSPTMYQMVAQRLDSNLGLVGNPMPIADSENIDATSFETRLSSGGSQALITYHQAGAKYRLLTTNSCN